MCLSFFYRNHVVQRLCESKEGSQYGQVVSQIPNLDLNENISTGLKQCECSVCGKVFVHLSLLNRHILAHSGYKPYGKKQYKCEQCGKFFVSVPGVRRHRITHSGNQVIKVRYVGKHFIFSIHLKDIRELTQERNPINVNNVVKRSLFPVLV